MGYIYVPDGNTSNQTNTAGESSDSLLTNATQDERHIETLKSLESLNNNLKILVTYYALIMGEEITHEDGNGEI